MITFIFVTAVNCSINNYYFGLENERFSCQEKTVINYGKYGVLYFWIKCENSNKEKYFSAMCFQRLKTVKVDENEKKVCDCVEFHYDEMVGNEKTQLSNCNMHLK